MRIRKPTKMATINLDKVKSEAMEEILQETADLLNGVVPCIVKWESELLGSGPIIHQDTFLSPNNIQPPPLKQEPRSVVFVGTAGVERGNNHYNDDDDDVNAFGLAYNGFVDDSVPIPYDYDHQNFKQQTPWIEHSFDLTNPISSDTQLNDPFSDSFLNDLTPFIPTAGNFNEPSPVYGQSTSFVNAYLKNVEESERLEQNANGNDPHLAFSMDESRLESLLYDNPQSFSDSSVYSPDPSQIGTSLASIQPFSASSFLPESVPEYSTLSSPHSYSSPSQNEILEEIYRECAEIERNSSASPPEQLDLEPKRKERRSQKPKEQQPSKSRENPISKRKNSKGAERSKKASGTNHKKELNRVAATKYREKKRQEREGTFDALKSLETRNTELKSEMKAVETEIGYLKNLIAEIKARATASAQ